MTEDNLTDEQRAKLDEVSRLTKEANEHYRARRYPAALPLYQQALTVEEEVFGPEHPSLAGLSHNLANLYYVQKKYAEAEAAYLRALSLLEQHHGPDAPELADVLLWLAETRFHNWHYEEAKEPYRRAAFILERQNDEEQLADALMRQAHLHYFIGEYAESEPLYFSIPRASEGVTSAPGLGAIRTPAFDGCEARCGESVMAIRPLVSVVDDDDGSVRESV
jgi:tetratricopeptide (TPR) repeat protein